MCLIGAKITIFALKTQKNIDKWVEFCYILKFLTPNSTYLRIFFVILHPSIDYLKLRNNKIKIL